MLQASHRYGNSRAMWDHTVLPATRQRWHSSLYPSQLRLVLDLATHRDARLSWPSWEISCPRVSQKPRVRTSPDSRRMLPVAVVRSSFNDRAINYLLPVLWMMCLHVIAGRRLRENDVCSKRPTGEKNGGRSLLSTISMFNGVVCAVYSSVRLPSCGGTADVEGCWEGSSHGDDV